MATYWKEVVNFGGKYNLIKLQLLVKGGNGVCVLDCSEVLSDGKIQLLTKEGEALHDFKFGKCEFNFKTQHRDYCVRIFDGDKLLCGGGNNQNLKHEFAVPKIIATDTFEERVADFNYYETELGEKGKTLEGILKEENAEISHVKDAEKIELSTNDVEYIKSEEIIKSDVSEPIKEEEKQETETVESEKSDKNEEKTAKNGKKSGKSKKKTDFFNLAKPQVEKMLAKFPKEQFLEDVLDNSKWVKVDFSKGVSYAVGIVYADDLVGYIGYAVKGKFSNPPKFENPQFVPFDITKPNGEGYFLIFQRADTGEKV